MSFNVYTFILLDSSKFTDFIVGHDESTLEVHNAGFDLNVGGVTDGVSSEGVTGCKGKAITVEPFKRGDIE